MSYLSLEIARVEELLIKEKQTHIATDNTLAGSNLQIPPYQRPYKWTTKNADQLLHDIEQAFNTNRAVYRVGTLILHHDRNGNYNIVDGQQRIITFSLLLKALDIKNELKEFALPYNQQTINNIKQNFNSFQRRLDENSDNNEHVNDNFKKQLADYILHNCEFVVVITNNLSEAFQFFDSQNARGKSLYPHDLLKAYHLREMNEADTNVVEQVVNTWETIDQSGLNILFCEYLYRLKRWMNNNRAGQLNEQNIDMFKGLTQHHNQPFAQYYKGATAFAENYNNSNLPFLLGTQPLKPFLLEAPIIAGRYFFDYTKHYHDVLADIRNNNRYEGCFINDNPIVKTLDTKQQSKGIGNSITRLMFDTAILLYTDRFCSIQPSATELKQLEHFVVYAFVWAYSLRVQYRKVGWLVAQNYLLGKPAKEAKNAFNIYRAICLAISPDTLVSYLAGKLQPLTQDDVRNKTDNINATENGVPTNVIYHFVKYKYFIQ